ncbi:hypothetical protein C8R44DRAFT_746009 [Mycena epipterygia]|nr:hypothetical protein C8R44DRAFT_746009 [Mycena epipterygia]
MATFDSDEWLSKGKRWEDTPGTASFAHLPANSFLALLPKEETVNTFDSHVEIGPRAHTMFQEISAETALLAKAVISTYVDIFFVGYLKKPGSYIQTVEHSIFHLKLSSFPRPPVSPRWQHYIQGGRWVDAKYSHLYTFPQSIMRLILIENQEVVRNSPECRSTEPVERNGARRTARAGSGKNAATGAALTRIDAVVTLCDAA